MKTIIVLKEVAFSYHKDDYLIGVERGALEIMKRNLPLELAIGDFDSVSFKEKDEILKYAKKVITLNPIKDESDSEATFKYLKENNYQKLIVYGALGNRFDHSFVNFQLVYKYDVTLVDENNKIFALKKGIHQIKKKEYSYLSLFTLENTTISLSGVKYPLHNRTIDSLTSYTLSNEILQDDASIEVINGVVLVVLSRD